MSEIFVPSNSDLAIIYEMKNLRDNFINGLEEIIKQKQFTWFKKKRYKIFTIRQKVRNKILKISLRSTKLKINTGSEFYEEDVIRNTNLVKQVFIQKKNKKCKVSMMIPIKNLFSNISIKGFFYLKKNQFMANFSLTFLADYHIIQCYNYVM